jgi:hypothetical protein
VQSSFEKCKEASLIEMQLSRLSYMWNIVK